MFDFQKDGYVSELINWPDFWDGGPGVRECELTDRYVDTCIERRNGMIVALKNVYAASGSVAGDKMLDRLRQSRSARIASMGIAMKVSDEELADCCRQLSDLIGSSLLPMSISEFDSDIHIMIADSSEGKVTAIARKRALHVYADMHIAG